VCRARIRHTTTKSPTRMPGGSQIYPKDKQCRQHTDICAHRLFTKLHRNHKLKARHAGIEGETRRIDANSFTAALYRDGKTAAECTIFMNSGFAGDIAYSGKGAVFRV
jgi:hypothetical protein